MSVDFIQLRANVRSVCDLKSGVYGCITTLWWLEDVFVVEWRNVSWRTVITHCVPTHYSVTVSFYSGDYNEADRHVRNIKEDDSSHEMGREWMER